MTTFLSAAAVDVLPALRVGHIRLTVYGVCAAAGLVLAVAFARRCARAVGMDPEWAWDAGLFAIVSCFLASRLLLVAFDLRSFLHYPVLVLGLPSLTYTGMAIAAVAVWVYLRRRRIPVLRMLDVFAGPGALLAAFLELGHFLDGSEVGMPTRMPWGMADPWSGERLRVHPVALYGVLVSLLLAWGLGRLLVRERSRVGGVAGAGMMLGGLAAFSLDTLSVPVPTLADLRIEPGQWTALVAIVSGAVLWAFAPTIRFADAAGEAERPDGVGVVGPEESPEPAGAARDLGSEVG